MVPIIVFSYFFPTNSIHNGWRGVLRRFWSWLTAHEAVLHLTILATTKNPWAHNELVRSQFSSENARIQGDLHAILYRFAEGSHPDLRCYADVMAEVNRVVRSMAAIVDIVDHIVKLDISLDSLLLVNPLFRRRRPYGERATVPQARNFEEFFK